MHKRAVIGRPSKPIERELSEYRHHSRVHSMAESGVIAALESKIPHRYTSSRLNTPPVREVTQGSGPTTPGDASVTTRGGRGGGVWGHVMVGV